MKKTTLLCIGLLVVSLQMFAGNYTGLSRQNKNSSDDDNGIKGKIMINAGVGFNLMRESLQIRYGLGDFWQDRTESIDGRETPMFGIGMDYGIARRFSAGVSFGYQTAQVIVHPTYPYYNNIRYTDSWTRIHFAAKGDYYIVAKEKLSVYTGLKIGYNAYSMTSNATRDYPGYYSQLNVEPSAMSLQAHIGLNYYFNNVIGFNAEAGIGFGGPYLLAVGIAVKI